MDSTLQRYAAFYPAHPALLPNASFWSDRLANFIREYSDRAKHYRLTTWIVPRLGVIGLSVATAGGIMINFIIDTSSLFYQAFYRARYGQVGAFKAIFKINNLHPRALLQFQRQHFAFTNQCLARAWHTLAAFNLFGLRKPEAFAELGLNPQQTFLRNHLLATQDEETLKKLGGEYAKFFPAGIIPTLLSIRSLSTVQISAFLEGFNPSYKLPGMRAECETMLADLENRHAAHPRLKEAIALLVSIYLASAKNLSLDDFKALGTRVKGIYSPNVAEAIWTAIGQLDLNAEETANAIAFAFEHAPWRVHSDPDDVAHALVALGKRYKLEKISDKIFTFHCDFLSKEKAPRYAEVIKELIRNGLLEQKWLQLRLAIDQATLLPLCIEATNQLLHPEVVKAGHASTLPPLAPAAKTLVSLQQFLDAACAKAQRVQHSDSLIRHIIRPIANQALLQITPDAKELFSDLRTLEKIIQDFYSTPALLPTDYDALFTLLGKLLEGEKNDLIFNRTKAILKCLAAGKTKPEIFAGEWNKPLATLLNSLLAKYPESLDDALINSIVCLSAGMIRFGEQRSPLQINPLTRDLGTSLKNLATMDGTQITKTGRDQLCALLEIPNQKDASHG